MPTYVYQCAKCSKRLEVFHSISELDNPTDSILEQTSCNISTCDNESLENKGERFNRVPQAPQLHGFYNGTSLKGAEKTNAVQKDRKKRATEHFNKEIKPQFGEGTMEKKHWDKKDK